jgi:GntR family transcriptional regulator
MTTWTPAAASAFPAATPSGPPGPNASLVPLYRQVSDDLRRCIAERGLLPGDALPPEAELCRAYGVSRITIRKALDELVARHLVTRRRGSGTFISDAERIAKSVLLTGYIDDVLMLNRMTVLDERWSTLPHHVAEFAVDAGDGPFKQITGVNRITEGEPIVHIAFWFPPDIATRVSAADVGGPLPTIRHIERSHDLRMSHAVQVIDPIAAPRTIADALGIARGMPVLRALRCYRDSNGRLIELFEAHYHPTRYRFSAQLYPRQG